MVASSVLGLAYNAKNPIGIRWDDPSPSRAVSGAAAGAPGAAPEKSVPAAPAPPVVHSSPSDTAGGKPTVAPATNNLPAAVPPQYAPPSPTTWAEVKPRAEKQLVVLVDARARSAYDAGHIPGAVNLPEPPPEDQLAAFRAQYPTNSHIVIYCSSTSCSLSFKLAHRLARDAGYGFVQYMTGGFLEWQREMNLAHGGTNQAPAADSATAPAPAPANISAGPSVPATSPPGTPQTTAQARSEVALMIRWSDVRPLLGAGQAVLLDARSRQDFDAGHIPGALWLAADASPEVIEATLAKHPRTTRWVAYCESMSCQQAFQLAVRLVREFDRANAQFMLEGYAEWKNAERGATGERAAR